MSIVTNQFACDALLFDLDGVLIDSTSCIVRHWQVWADQNQIDLNRILQAAHGIRTIETMRLVAPDLDIEEEARRFTALEVADTNGVVAIAGAYPLLAGLPKDAWAVVTSGSLELVSARLAKAGLPMPPALVTADDVRRGKPDPEPYLIGAKRLGTAPEGCIVIEDAPAGVEAGKKAGMRVIGIAATHTRAELLAQGADEVVENLCGLKINGPGDGYRLVLQTERESD